MPHSAQPASCRQYHSTLQIACQSGFGVIERSNLVLPVHYLNPVFYMALLSAWASLGKTAPELSWPSISSHQGISSPLACSVLQACAVPGYRAAVCPPVGDEGSLGIEKRQCHVLPRVALSYVEPRSWPENTETITHLVPVQPKASVVLCPFLLRFILSLVKCHCLGLMRSRDFVRMTFKEPVP